MITQPAREYLRTSHLLTPGVMRLYEYLTTSRNAKDCIGIHLSYVATLAGGDSCAALVDLQKIGAIDVKCVHDGIVMIEVVKPLRMARRVAA